ncbi:MAG TPA: hypothetical protein VMW78_04640 [Anaerolineae bacterium]|nr:hypothetical protein [Anaerolineae bacterium]
MILLKNRLRTHVVTGYKSNHSQKGNIPPASARSQTGNSEPQRHRALDDAKLAAMIWLEMGKI